MTRNNGKGTDMTTNEADRGGIRKVACLGRCRTPSGKRAAVTPHICVDVQLNDRPYVKVTCTKCLDVTYMDAKNGDVVRHGVIH